MGRICANIAVLTPRSARPTFQEDRYFGTANGLLLVVETEAKIALEADIAA